MNLSTDMKHKCIVIYIGTRKLVAMLGDIGEGAS